MICNKDNNDNKTSKCVNQCCAIINQYIQLGIHNYDQVQPSNTQCRQLQNVMNEKPKTCAVSHSNKNSQIVPTQIDLPGKT